MKRYHKIIVALALLGSLSSCYPITHAVKSVARIGSNVTGIGR